MDLYAPVPVALNPVGLDKCITSVQQQIATLPWIAKSYGRAIRVMAPAETGRMLYEPKVYAQRGEYISMMPNDQVKAFSFIIAHDPIRKAGEVYVSDISLIVYGSYNLVDPMADDIIEQRLLMELLDSLQYASVSHTVREIYTDTGSVYEGFNLGDLEGRFMQHPFFGFRIRMQVQFDAPC